MKKTLIIVSILFLLSGLLIWMSCGQSGSYKDAIPADVSVLAEIHLQETAREIREEPLLQKMGLSAERIRTSGLDLKEPFYFFISGHGDMGLLGRVSNRKELERFLKTKDFKVTTQKGDLWIESPRYISTVSGEKFLAMILPSPSARERIIRQMGELTGQKADPQRPLFSSLDALEGPIKLFFSPSFMVHQSFVKSGMASKLLGFFPQDSLFAAVCPGEQTVSLHLLTKGEKSHEFKRKLKEVLLPFENQQIKISDTAMASFATRLRGAELLELLKENPSLKTGLLALNLSFDADLILKSIEGDVELGIEGFSESEAQYLLQANLSNTDFMQNTPYWTISNKADGVYALTSLPKGIFRVKYEDHTLFWKVEDKRLYISNNQALMERTYQWTEETTVPGNRMEGQVDVPLWLSKYGPKEHLLHTLVGAHLEEVKIALDDALDVNLELKGKDISGCLSSVLDFFLNE